MGSGITGALFGRSIGAVGNADVQKRVDDMIAQRAVSNLNANQPVTQQERDLLRERLRSLQQNDGAYIPQVLQNLQPLAQYRLAFLLRNAVIQG